MQQRRTIMKISRVMPVLAFLIAGTLVAQDAQVTPLMSKDLAECPGKEGLMITVVYPPGASDPRGPGTAISFRSFQRFEPSQLGVTRCLPQQSWLREDPRHAHRYAGSAIRSEVRVLIRNQESRLT